MRPGSSPSRVTEDVRSTDLAWKFGRGRVTAKNLVLVSLDRVSKGSWYPFLRLFTQVVSRILMCRPIREGVSADLHPDGATTGKRQSASKPALFSLEANIAGAGW
jgi:hypothetical protein